MKIAKNNVLYFTKQGCCRLQGPIGQALDKCVRNQLKKTDYRKLCEPFITHADDDGGWRGEFWGKTVRSLILAWYSTRDPELLDLAKEAVNGIIAALLPNGGISSCSSAKRLKSWDLWGRKYVLLGLERYYTLIGKEERVEKAIVSILDNILGEVEAHRFGILNTGEHEGMASSSILGAVTKAWKITGDHKYYDFYQKIILSGCSHKHDILNAAERGVPPAEIGNAKAYEMMSCFKGITNVLEELPDSYAESVLRFYEMVRDREIMITGVAGATNCGEFWYNGKLRQTWRDAGKLGETCITVTWLQFCGRILALTGDSSVADEMELCGYNALLGAMTPEGDNWTHRNPTPLSAPAWKIPADDQMLRNFGTPFDGHDCCRAQGPEGLAQMSLYAVMQSSEGIVINFYEALTAEAHTASGSTVGIHISGKYPDEGSVEITLTLDAPQKFPLFIRIPAWWDEASTLEAGGEPVEVLPGRYCRLEREWQSGDRLVVTFAMKPRFVAAPGDHEFTAVLCGPLVMARDSRLAGMGVPVGQEIVEVSRQPEFGKVIRFADDTMMCDYRSAGNRFSADNLLQVWHYCNAE